MPRVVNHLKGQLSFVAGPDRVVLSVGANDVDGDLWSRVQTANAVKRLLERGEISVSGDVPKPAKKAEPKPKPMAQSMAEVGPVDLEEVAQRKATEVVSFVKLSADVDLLRDLKDMEDRKTVLAAIEDRIEELEDGSDVY